MRWNMDSFRSSCANRSTNLLTVLRRVQFDDGGLFSFALAGVTVLMIGSVLRLLHSRKKKKKTRSVNSSALAPVITPASIGTGLTLRSSLLSGGLTNRNTREKFPVSDASYAEELQFHEALVASLLTSQMTNNGSSSVQDKALLDSKNHRSSEEVDGPSESFCEICLEKKERWRMFENDSCSHSFCYDCTSNHIVAKIQENTKMVPCPGVNCKAALNFNACRLMIPKDVLMRWDEFLCISSILESQKLYCPFRDCSTMLEYDSRFIIRETICPLCRRSFCAQCRVPWHSEFTCKEFQELTANKKETEDNLVKMLAKKKSWMQCPNCKFYVEKSQGCLHIVCRCKYEFCYGCGKEWSPSHKCRRQ